ncbi:hypothetical protein GCM10009795_061880 [Nocardioides hankookensis]|uniref:ABC transporter permease n=1 Tax=Nocardioides hankookensis TaxID=443157 RepID=A0ABW1LNN9_9ACTN
MIGLLRVELTRLRWRRAVLLLLGATVAIPAIIFAFLVHDTRPRPQEYADYQYYYAQLSIVEERTGGSGIAVALILAMLFVLVGTTFVGHDWNTGSMSNQLLFEPRRGRVWLVKAVALAAVALVISLVVLTAYWSGLWAISVHRDIDIPDHAVSAAYKQGVLGAYFASAAAVFGYSLTMFFRSTVATLGVLFGVAVAGGALVGATGLSDHAQVMPWTNYEAFMVGSSTTYDWDCFPNDGFVDDDACTTVVTRAESLPYFGVVVAVAAAGSVIMFRRRDVP